MPEKRDYYEVLGVGRDATPEDLKKAYRKMAKQYHPDVNSGNKESEAKFKEVNEAYAILSDAQKKAQYDQFGHAAFDQTGGGPGGFGGFDFNINDIFESFFGGGFGSSSHSRRGPQKGQDIRYQMEVKFEEAAFGIEREITFQKMQDCSTCEGTGAKPGTRAETCKHCGGTGQVQERRQTPFGNMTNVKTCDACRGEGKIIASPCSQCQGRGKIRKTVKLRVKVPAGIDDDQMISLRGEGEPGIRGGPPGDLYIAIRVKPHPFFHRDGMNIFCEIPITFTQAALGAEIDVPTLDGKVKFHIPEGTQNSTDFRLRQKGIPSLRGGGRGDLYVKVLVEVPRKLNEKQKELLRQFSEQGGDEHYEKRKGFFDR
ncbi:MAG TPA: molecular chaperone DnaJ, partial [Clostridiales bacterium]|nr:molecular chaperone DnaJ [Clostridiales bacterium]